MVKTTVIDGECDRHGRGSKPIRAILMSPWKRHFAARSSDWTSLQGLLNFGHISKFLLLLVFILTITF